MMTPRRSWVAAGLAVVVVLAMAIGGRARSTALVPAPAQPDEEVAITYPPDGAEVPGPGVLVQWTAPSTGDDGEELHVDLIADDGATRVERAGNPAVVPGLDPGEHTIELVVLDEDDQEVTDAGSASVTITVLETLPATLQAGDCDNLEADPVEVLNDVESGFEAADDVGEGIADEATEEAGAIQVEEEDEGEDGISLEVEEEEPLPLGASEFTIVEISDTTLDLSLETILGDDHALAVYAAGSDDDDAYEDDERLACGEIGGPLFVGALRVGLVPVEDSNSFGIATLSQVEGEEEGEGEADEEQTRIRIQFVRGEAEPEEPAPAGPAAQATNTPTATATATAVPPTPTAAPATETPAAATDTPAAATEPPAATDTPVPTDTPAPTNTPVPTDTPVPPPTDTPAA